MNNQATDILKKFQEKHFADKNLDIKSPKILASVRKLADEVLKLDLTANALIELEEQMTDPDVKPTFHNLTHLALKIAKSKTLLRLAPTHTQISVVMPAYGENTRMKKRGTGKDEDPLGEDFVVEKSKQLQWLFEGTPASYHVFIVDDMSKADPVTSGSAANLVIAKEGIEHFTVLFLEDGVKNVSEAPQLTQAALRGVSFPKNTKKAGSVYYGMAKAIEQFGEDRGHIIFLTDCDLSVDLGQLGNLVSPLFSGDVVAAAGSRRLTTSILEIVGSRNLRANTARYFRQLLLPGLLPKDTQCGAKAFASHAIAKVLEANRKVLDFAFDIELLTLIALQNGPEKVVPVAVAWFDSAELTTTDSSVHFGIMKAQLAIALANQTGSGLIFDQLVDLTETLTASEEDWLGFLETLEKNPQHVEAMQTFDTSILPELKTLAIGA